MNITYRILEKNDFKIYIQLISQFRPIGIEIDYEIFNNIYDKIFTNSEIYVAVFDNKLIGSITVIYEQKFIHNLSIYAHIEDVIVDENYRHMKIGSKLLDYVKKIAKEKKCFKLSLVCNDMVKPFYLNNNFEERGLNMSYLL
jgi:glucosamine-phosphate N-acetyltransferase